MVRCAKLLFAEHEAGSQRRRPEMKPEALARRAGSAAGADGGGIPSPAPDARKESDGDGKKVATESNDSAWDEEEEALGALIYKASRAAKARDEVIIGKKRRASKEEEAPARSKREDRRKESGETSVMPRASSSSATLHDADEEALGALIYKNSRTAKARAQAKNGKTRHREKPPSGSDEGKPPRKKRRRKAKEEGESSREKCAVPDSSTRPRRGAAIKAAAKLSPSGSDGEQRETSVTRARPRRHVVAIEAATKTSGHMLEEDGGSDDDESLGYDSDSSGVPKKQPSKSNKRRSRNPTGKGGFDSKKKRTEEADPDRPKSIEDVWNDKCRRLKEFCDTHGHWSIHPSYRVDGFLLASWANIQIQACKRGQLSKARQEKLKAIGFRLTGNAISGTKKPPKKRKAGKIVEDSGSSNPAKSNVRLQSGEPSSSNQTIFDARWNDRFEQLRAYKEVHGHCNVNTWKYAENPQLATWVHTQRVHKKKGWLPEARRQRLDGIWFTWAVNPFDDKSWRERFELLSAYKAEHGDCDVPQKYVVDGFGLGLWVRRQRKMQEEGVLSNERRERLREVGFLWSVSMGKKQRAVSGPEHCSRKTPPEEIEPLGVGDAVLAYYLYSCGKKGDWIDATITNVNTHSLDGVEWATYDVEYNDGYTDDHLPNSKIRRCPPPEDNGKEEDSDGEEEAAEEKRATRNRSSDVELQRVAASTNRREERAAARKKRTARNAPADGDEESRPVPHDDARTRKQIKEDALWSEKFEQLLAYKTEHGHCNVTASCDGDDHLGEWVEGQRQQYEFWEKGEHSELTDERVARLESVDFDFAPGRMTRNSRSRDKRLQSARKKHAVRAVASAPHERPRRSAAKKAAVKLSRRTTEGDSESDGCSSKLDESSAVGEKESFEEAEYDSDSSDSPKTRRPKLRRNRERARAVANTRAEDRMRRDKEGKAKLWMENYEVLRRFKSKHMHCDVPYEYAQDPVLGRWVNEQRKMRKKNRLTKDRRTKLERIGFLWKPQGTLKRDRKERMWQEMFKRLQGFRKEHGHCEVLALYPEDPPLGRFVKAQRAEWREGQLPEDRKKLLDGIGFSWTVTVQGRAKKTKDDAKWEDRLEQLRRYKSKEGHCHVPKKLVVNGINLGQWVHNQRRYLKNGTLSHERKERLGEIGMVWAVLERGGKGSVDDRN